MLRRSERQVALGKEVLIFSPSVLLAFTDTLIGGSHFFFSPNFFLSPLFFPPSFVLMYRNFVFFSLQNKLTEATGFLHFSLNLLT